MKDGGDPRSAPSPDGSEGWSRGSIRSCVALIQAYNEGARGKWGVICMASLHNDDRPRGEGGGGARFATRAQTRERVSEARWTVTRRRLALGPGTYHPLGTPLHRPALHISSNVSLTGRYASMNV